MRFVATQLSVSPFGEFAEKAIEALKAAEGMPLEMHWNTPVQGFGAKTEMVATEVKVGPLPAAMFRVPAGFIKVDAGYQDPKDKSRPEMAK